MTPRRITAAICLAAIVLLLVGAFSKRWFVADLRTSELNGSLRMGLTGVSACMATVDATHCEQVTWSQLQSLYGGRLDDGGWMWLGRITFGLALAAAIALASLAGFALLESRVVMPSPLPTVALWCCGALLPLMAGYWLLTPGAFAAIAAGRGFAFAGLGAIAGIVAASRETSDRLD